MTLTVSDFFAGAGGSSTGMLQVPGIKVRVAANHWKTALDIHNANHQDTDHAHVDLHLERPSYFPRTDLGWFSPECTKWSQASGAEAPAIEVGLFEDPLSDDAKTRSRLLMFDVLRYIEHHRYRLVFVENVVDIATQKKYATAWQVWRQELRALGYAFRVVSLNSMHAQLFGLPAPQSRDRIYIVAWPENEKAPDLDRVVRPHAYCTRCDAMVESVQSWIPRRTVGRYRQAYSYRCPRCNAKVEPGWLPAATAIDWTLAGERIGDRERPLKPKTLARIAAGIARYWGPLAVEAAGNTYDAADPRHPNHGDPEAYYRSWPIFEAMRTLQTTATRALAVPVEGRTGKEALPVDAAGRTQTTRAETALAHLPFIAEMYGTSTARPVTDPAGTFTAGGNHHGLVMTNQHDNRARTTDEAMPTMTTATGGGSALLAPYYGNAHYARSVDDPMGTLPTHDRFALIHRMNSGGAEMTTPVDEELRTLTTGGNVALLEQPDRRRVTPADLRAAQDMVPDVLFRMLQPHEVAAGMAFPASYNWQPGTTKKPVTNRDLVKAAGNAVTPPAARDIVGVAIDSIGAAA